MLDTSVNLAGVLLKNPVMSASGTFGKAYADYVDLNALGALVTKGVSFEPWEGNPPPRIAETYGGMLNSIGLQNPGVERFIEKDLPFYRKYDTKLIVNVCGHTNEEYAQVVERLNDIMPDMLELNISCPNIANGGISFGTDTAMVSRIVSEIKKIAKPPVIVKLSPNVTNIAEIAKAAEAAGADALSLINTLLGMRIDIKARKPILANKVGGLSGPAIKPVAVRMVWQVAKAVKIPIIGMGGIASGEDAIEFIMAGATAVAVGCASFNNPRALTDVAEGIERFMKENGIQRLDEIRGCVE